MANLEQTTEQVNENATANGQTVKAEPTSEKLVELRRKLSETAQGLKSLEYGTPEFDTAINSITSLKKDIEAELANIARHERELAIAEQKNAKIAMVQTLVDVTARLAQLPKNATQEQRDAVATEQKTAFDAIANELTARIGGTAKPATVAGEKPAGTRGGTTQAIKDAYAALLAENPSIPYKEAREKIEAMGFARGTVGAATLEYRREHNLP